MLRCSTLYISSNIVLYCQFSNNVATGDQDCNPSPLIILAILAIVTLLWALIMLARVVIISPIDAECSAKLVYFC